MTHFSLCLYDVKAILHLYDVEISLRLYDVKTRLAYLYDSLFNMSLWRRDELKEMTTFGQK